jgi:long-chain acyl-CoA synthetase
MTCATYQLNRALIVSGVRGMSRAEIDERALRAANGFREFGVKRNDTVALLLRNDFVFFEASKAITALGASPVALNWHLTTNEVRYVLEDCGAKALVAHADMLNLLSGAIPEGFRVLGVNTPPEIVDAYSLKPAQGRLDSAVESWDRWLEGFAPLTDVCRDFTETVIYTSGTTGKPKGVRRFPQSEQNAKRLLALRDKVYGIKPGIRALICGPLYHAAPNAFAMRAITAAEKLVLLPRFDAAAFLESVERNSITAVFMVPTMFVRLLKLPPDVRARYDVSSLRHITTAAAHCPPEVKKAITQWFGPIVHEFYASTEANYVSYCSPDDAAARPGTVGRLVDGVRVRFLDEQGHDVPSGEPGEIFTRLTFAADFTYANHPEDRALLEIDGLIGTGDVGYLDTEGYLFLCDRRGDMVISGGVNIYPAEIEAELVSLDGVRDCAVFGIPDQEYGEQLIAVIEPEEGTKLTANGIIAQLRARLAGFKVPRIIDFCSGLPRDDAGKLYKRRIRDSYRKNLRDRT